MPQGPKALRLASVSRIEDEDLAGPEFRWKRIGIPCDKRKLAALAKQVAGTMYEASQSLQGQLIGEWRQTHTLQRCTVKGLERRLEG